MTSKTVPVVGSKVGYITKYNEVIDGFTDQDTGVVEKVFEHKQNTYLVVKFPQITTEILLNELVSIV